MQLRISEVDPLGAEALRLLREAGVEGRGLYPEDRAIGVPWPTNSPTPQRGSYVLAYLSGLPVGSGSLLQCDEHIAEVRRLFVLPAARRQGIGRALLRHLERDASRFSYKLMRLETGNRQTAAMALYESCGFTRIPPFGPYLNSRFSVCYEKPVALQDSASSLSPSTLT